MPQAEIAKQPNIPVGTVKSRLHTAKQNFKNKYPYRTDGSKGERSIKKLPEFIPEYKIEESTELPSLTAMNSCPTGDLAKITAVMEQILRPRGIFREQGQLLQAPTRIFCWIS